MAIFSWKMLSAAWLGVLVTSLAATIDTYDEMTPGDMSLMYQDQSYIDPGAQSSALEVSEEDAMRNLVLYKMLNSLRNQAVSPNILAGPKWISSGTGLVPPETFDMSLLKGPVLKRGLPTTDVLKVAAKPGQKWKLKKGRVSSFVVCYFKLCAFRPPN